MFGKVINSFLTDAPSVFTILIFTLLHETDLKDACCVLKKVVSGVPFFSSYTNYGHTTGTFSEKRDKKGDKTKEQPFLSRMIYKRVRG